MVELIGAYGPFLWSALVAVVLAALAVALHPWGGSRADAAMLRRALTARRASLMRGLSLDVPRARSRSRALRAFVASHVVLSKR